MLKVITKDFIIGVKAFIKAFVFLFEYNLWLYFFVPVLLFVSMYLGADLVHKNVMNYDIQGQLAHIDFQAELKDFRWFKGFPTDSKEIELIIVALEIIFIVSVLRMKRYLILILMSPLLAFVSTRIEFIVVENKYKWDTKQFVKDIYRGVNFALRNMFRQILILGLWSVFVTFLSDLEVFSPYVSFIVGAYYYGASLMDYINERRRLTMNESIQYIRKHIGLTMAIGIIFYAMFFIEFIGFIVAPITAVVAATLAIHEIEDLSKNKFAERDKRNKVVTSKLDDRYKDDPWSNG
jgi:CysZ protein